MDLDLIKIAVALVPVLVFLAGFMLLDAFRLVSWPTMLVLLAAGGVLA